MATARCFCVLWRPFLAGIPHTSWDRVSSVWTIAPLAFVCFCFFCQGLYAKQETWFRAEGTRRYHRRERVSYDCVSSYSERVSSGEHASSCRRNSSCERDSLNERASCHEHVSLCKLRILAANTFRPAHLILAANSFLPATVCLPATALLPTNAFLPGSAFLLPIEFLRRDLTFEAQVVRISWPKYVASPAAFVPTKPTLLEVPQIGAVAPQSTVNLFVPLVRRKVPAF